MNRSIILQSVDIRETLTTAYFVELSCFVELLR